MKNVVFTFIQVLVFFAALQIQKAQSQTPTLTYPVPLAEYSPGQAIDFDVDLYSNGLIDQLCAVRYYIYKDDMTTPVASVTPYGTISYTVRGLGTNYVTNSITDGQGFVEVEALNDMLQAFTLGIFDNYCVDRDRPINVDMNFSTPGNYRFTIEIVSCANQGISAGTTYTATNCGGLVHTDSVADTCMTPVVLNTYSIDFTITSPSVTYSTIDAMYNTSEDISTTALVYSNGLVDELCGVRYAIYKDGSTTPIDSVNDYGTVTYTVRGQGTALITTPIKAGQGYIEVIALNDTLQAFTLGIFDNYCIDRNRPIDIDMNFTVPGDYRFEAEIVSCGNAGISAGTTFTDQNCGGTLHTDSVSEECMNPVVLTEGEVETTVCGESEITYASGDLIYFAGQPVEVVYNVGNFDDGIDSSNLPSWLDFSADTTNNTITVSGTAPAYDALTPSYTIELTTTSTENPSSCPTATTNLIIQVQQGPEIGFTPIIPVYNVGDSIYTTARIYSHGYVDELAAVRYNLYRNTALVNQIDAYGHMEYSVRVTGTNYDTTEFVNGSGFVTMSPVSDTLSAFTLGIFDNTCVDRNRPIDLFATFNVPGEYVFNSELVSCTNNGTATGTSFVAANCDNQIHYDSVAENCLGPEMLFAETVGFTVCGESEIAYASGSNSYCSGGQIDLVYNVGDYDDGINASSFPSWLTYSVNTANHTVSLHGTVPQYDPLNPSYSITLTTTSSENPVSCPTASLVQAITVKECYRDTITEVICEGDSIVIGTTAYYNTGIHSNTMTAVNGCDSTIVLDLTVHPTRYSEFTEVTENATYTWNSIVYNASGDYTQTLTSIETGCDSIVTLHLTITIGIDELNNAVVSVYPNPTDNFVYVETSTEAGSQCLIEVHDVYGRIISSKEITDNKTMIDLSEMASGIYFLKVIDGEKIIGTAFVTKQ